MLDSELTSIVYGTPSEESRRAYFEDQSVVDLAHLVMLKKRNLIDASGARSLAATIVELRHSGFRDLLEAPAPRGEFVAYEEFLTGNLGRDIGGRLHTGRSRNDLNATIHSMNARRAWIRSLRTVTSVVHSLVGSARKHADLVIPGFSHYQAAMPSSLGAYLANAGLSLAHQGNQLIALHRYFESCPLGACAGFGTSIPIDPEITASLLGYTTGPGGSISAVADRSASSLTLGVLAESAVLYSRIAADLQFWSAGPVAIIDFPDNLVGQSSIMPQKRNAFVLENLKARCSRVISAHTAALVSMKSAPFTNTIEVGTESVAGFQDAIADFIGMSTLIRWHIDLAVPNPDRSHAIMRHGKVNATFEAERAVLDQGIAFRDAYSIVQTQTRSGPSSGCLEGGEVEFIPADYGAGPSGPRTEAICESLEAEVERMENVVREFQHRIDKSEMRLREEVQELLQ